MLLYYENIIQFIAFLCGLIAWKRVRPPYTHWIILLLGLTVVNESIIIPYVMYHRRNVDYNVYSFFDMATWLFVFYQVHKGKAIQKIIKPAAAFLFLYSLMEIYWKGWGFLHTDSFRAYEIVILLLSCSYLYSIFRVEYHVLVYDPIFWIAAACIIYHAILFLNFTTLAENGYWFFKGSRKVFDVLQVIGNIFYYLFLSFSFFSCFNSKSNKTDSCQE